MPSKRTTNTTKASIVRATPFASLPAAEREAIFQSVDREFTRAETKPLTRAERRELATIRARRTAGKATTGEDPASAKRPPGRPATGVTTQSVMVSVEKGLLKEADAYAKSHGLKRTQLVAAGLRLAMANGVTAATVKA